MFEINQPLRICQNAEFHVKEKSTSENGIGKHCHI